MLTLPTVCCTQEEWRLQCEEARRHLAVAQDELRLQREDMALMKVGRGRGRQGRAG